MIHQTLAYLYDTDGNTYLLQKPIQFLFRKEKYTPYTELNITVQDTEQAVPAAAVFNRVQLVLNGQLLHDGIIDTADYRTEHGVSSIAVKSRGFTSLLLNNEMTPGVHTEMSLDRLMTEYYDFPSQIHWQPDSDASNYIYVRAHSSMWESVVNLGYKLYKNYPYIRRTNQIRLQLHDDADGRIFTSSEVLSSGARTMGNRLLSHLHMADLEGNYGTYHLENPDAADMYIVRHKQLAFDRQYLNDPMQSMNLKFALASQGWRSYYVTCNGYVPLDLNDFAGVSGVFSPGRISAVTVTGNSSGIRSTFAVYHDAFS